MLVHLEGAGATAKAHFVVPYVQWGLKNPSFLIWKADNDVAIDLPVDDIIGAVSPDASRGVGVHAPVVGVEDRGEDPRAPAVGGVHAL